MPAIPKPHSITGLDANLFDFLHEALVLRKLNMIFVTCDAEIFRRGENDGYSRSTSPDVTCRPGPPSTGRTHTSRCPVRDE